MKLRLATWLAFVLACLAVVVDTRFTADMSAFLPASPTAAQQLLVDQLRHGPVSRLLLVAIEGEPESSGQRAAMSRALVDTLAPDPAFATVANGARPPDEQEQALLFRYRYLIGDAVDAGRFTPEGMREAIGASLEALASPLGMAYKALLPRDPTGETLRMIDRLQPVASPAYRDGVWSSVDGRRSLVLVQLAEDGTELDAQEAALATVQRAFEQARSSVAAATGVEVQLAVSGTARFAVESRDRIRKDVARLSAVGSLLILLLLGSVLRSPRLLLTGVVPVATGALASVAAVSLAFGQVHGMTIGFGIALIGEAIDYAIYVLVQGSQARLWRTIRLGVLTSLIGFSVLLLSGFPGLAQLGLFAVTGIVVAAVVTAGLLGPMFPRPPVTVPRWAAGALQAGLARMGRLRRVPAIAMVAAVAIVAALALQRPLWATSLEALSPVSDAAKQLDARLRSDLGAPDLRYVVAITASDPDAALAGARQAGELLEPLVRSGVLAGFDSPARALPDEATQLARRDRLPDPQALRAMVEAATAGTPLRADRLAPFQDDVARSRGLEPLGLDDIAGTTFALGVDSLMVRAPGRSSAILPLRAPDAADGYIDATAVRTALAAFEPAHAIHLLDIKAETDSLYAGYLAEARLLSLGGVVAIVLAIAALLYRQAGTAARAQAWSRLGRVVLPISAAVACVIAGLALAGIELTILHLVGLLLTVAVGSNYTLFFLEDAGDDPTVLASLALANLTTITGFGILGFASVPVLNAIGMTVGPGAFLCLAFAAMRGGRPGVRDGVPR